MGTHPLAGKPVPKDQLIDVDALLKAYDELSPDVSITSQRVSFGTSGHRGTARNKSFNQDHIAAITQAICDYRKKAAITGPLFIGVDTHALSAPAQATALSVLIANDVDVMWAADGEFTPTPVISFAIIEHNRKSTKLADGIVVTPSHNPPEDGGFKYNPPHGGPADAQTTTWIENRANELLANGLQEVRRSVASIRKSDRLTRYDFVTPYVDALGDVADMKAIAESQLRLGADPMGGAGVHYWAKIADRYGINLQVVRDVVDPTFSFMTLDRDGKVRMDCSSPDAMAGLLALKDRYDIAFGNDTDFDRHGIVCKNGGLLNPNHFLCVAADYLFRHRQSWPKSSGVGKTLVSSAMIDRICTDLGRPLVEVPVGFKWFVRGLTDSSLGFAGEESAGATFLRRDGKTWTTDKDGFVMALLAAEITAVTGTDPFEYYGRLEAKHGAPVYERIDAPANSAQKNALKKLSAEDVKTETLAGDPVTQILTHAPSNNAAIGGVKVSSRNGWFAARPSGTEDVYKIYAESFSGMEHLRAIQVDAKTLVDRVLSRTATSK